ncbi:MAG: T9SS type A sorting domain-containing protein [Flavobacteriales bacterium]
MIKQLLLISALAASTLTSSAQVVSDSVTMGSGYSNQVFYQLSTGNKTIANAADWDLQFFSSLFSASIRVNSGFDVELYAAASSDTSNFTTATLDTSSLTILRDGYATWETDAFTSQATGHPNYGWGAYQGLGNLVGLKVYAIKLTSGVFKKIWIKEFKTSGTITFTVADLDGSNSFTKTISRSAYSAKRHFYYDVENDSIYDSEPGKTDWELVFRKYSDQAGPQYYNVTGALTNDGLAIAQVNNTSIADAQANWNTHTYDSTINIIGYDWKSFNMGTFSWDITDSLSFIMKDYTGDVYQLVFTGTSGSSTGKMYFTKELFSTVSLEENSPVMNVGVFPNPANSFLTVNFELIDASVSTQIRIMDMNGRLVKTIANNFMNSGVNQITTDISDLTQGVYFLQIIAGNKSITKRVVKQ